MKEINDLLVKQENLTAEELTIYSYEVFKSKLIATTSFGATSGVLIHLLYKLKLPIKIVYVNTGFLFSETFDYIEQIKTKYHTLEFIELKPNLAKDEFTKRYGNNLYQANPDLCCRINKVEPFNEYLEKEALRAWITGIRRDQTDFRNSLSKITTTKKGLYKICPLLNWTSKEVYYYMKENNIPFHPLYEKGYTSIGCEPCTELPISGERSGRWRGKEKKECGLHTEL